MLFMMNMVEYEVQFSLISPSSFTLKIHPLYALRVQGGLFFDSISGRKHHFCSVFDKNTKNCSENFTYNFHKNIGLQKKIWYISNDMEFCARAFGRSSQEQSMKTGFAGHGGYTYGYAH